MVLTMPPGPSLDIIARLIANKLTEAWKQPVVVENRPGAGGNVGAIAVVKSEPDGYTFLIPTQAIAISPSIYRKLPYDPFKDLVPVSQIYKLSFVMVVHPAVPAKTVAELVAYAKANPGRLNYGSSGAGGTPHLAAELFKSLTGTDIVQVPYKGVAPMNVALITNEVQVIFTTLIDAQQHMKSGKMRALAVTGKTRSALMPDVPTLVEAGVQGYELPNWIGMYAPAGTPPEILTKLHAELVKILAMPDVRDYILKGGNEIVGSSPEEFAAVYKADVAKFARIIKDARIPLQD
ncbi:MAG: tripartite tricarboxylate transporter substrate binding protein [Betaproteobacteria bacterium]|nr:tripartite tricarboxylate transporter substrate binding protein [Betaproteobacteria bacterium]